MIRFLNESSPQTTAYTVRLWSFHKPVIIKDTSKYRANTFGFHSINGKSAVDFQVHSKKENAVRFLKKIWENNPGKKSQYLTTSGPIIQILSWKLLFS
ncbi:MAG: hypothetical protein AAE983_08005 [Thermoplasmataceae archaeon]|jgi:hypothetical protein